MIISFLLILPLIIRLKEVKPDKSPERYFCREDSVDFSGSDEEGPGGDEYYKRLSRDISACCEGLDGTFMQNLFDRSPSRFI